MLRADRTSLLVRRSVRTACETYTDFVLPGLAMGQAAQLFDKQQSEGKTVSANFLRA
jgi:hypothetical protein